MWFDDSAPLCLISFCNLFCKFFVPCKILIFNQKLTALVQLMFVSKRHDTVTTVIRRAKNFALRAAVYTVRCYVGKISELPAKVSRGKQILEISKIDQNCCS